MRRVVPLLVLVLAGCRPSGVQPPSEVVPPSPAEAPATESLMLGYVGADRAYHLLDPATMRARKLFGGIGRRVGYAADGRTMAYVGEDGRIFLADLVTGTSEPVARSDDILAHHFSLSPDGLKLAYVDSGAIKVWSDGLVQTVEGPTDCTVPGWSPDSRRLAIGTMAEGDETRDGGLWVWDGKGEARQIVAAGPSDEGCTQEVMWSPDGQWLAWARGYGDGWSGDIVRSDGADLRRYEIAAGPLEWLPDSSGLICYVHVDAGAFSTGVYRLDDATVIPLGPEDKDTHHCLSPDGTRVLVFGSGEPNVMIDLATGQEQTWGPEATVEVAAWAPDGTIALGVRAPDEARLIIWLCDAQGEVRAKTAIKVGWSWAGRWVKLPAEGTSAPVHQPGPS